MTIEAITLGAIATGAITGGVACYNLFQQYQQIQYDWLGDELAFDEILSDNATVKMKSGELWRAFHVTGLVYETMPITQQESYGQGRAMLINQLGKLNIDVRIFAIKRERDISYDANYPTFALNHIGDREHEIFEHAYKIAWYIVIQNKNIKPLNDASDKINSLLTDYNIHALERELDTSLPCRLTQFINHLVTGEYCEHINSLSNNISANINQSDIHFNTSGDIYTYTNREYHQRIIAIQLWADDVSGEIIADILKLKGEIEICFIALPSNTTKELTTLKSRQTQLSNAMFRNDSLANQYEIAQSALVDDNYHLFNTQLQIMVRDNSKDKLNDLIKQICDILARKRILYAVETRGASHAYFNRIPDKTNNQLLRPLALFNQNIASIMPFNHAPIGMKKSAWSDMPVRLLRTTSGLAYSFQFHVSAQPQARGHYLVFAPTGGGKSTIIMHLLSGLAKMQGVSSYIFDSQQGTRFMVEAFGGQYMNYDTLSLNPLDVDGSSPLEKQNLMMVLRAMVGETNDEIDQALNHLMDTAFNDIQRDMRTFNNLFNVAFANNSTAGSLFEKWVTTSKGKQGIYAHIFNAPQDGLIDTLRGSFMSAINMNEALDDPILAPAVVTHISNAISQVARAGQKGFNIFIDEGAKLIQNEAFKKQILVMYREYRKLNGVVGMAFQDPGALAQAGIDEVLIQNTSTFIFLPDATATKDIYAPFNLNDEQFNFIKNASSLGEGRRCLLVKRDASTGIDESVILDIDLSNYGDCLQYYKSGSDAIKLMTKLQNEKGASWVKYLNQS